MGAKTNSELITYAKAYLAAGACYWYGGTGSIGTKELYQRKQKQYPNYYPTAQYEATDYFDQDGKIVMDCCGLVKACLNASAPGQPAPYVKANDLSAPGYYTSGCIEKGTLDSTYTPYPGQLVFKTNDKGICHVGIYIGNGKCIEAKGHQWGVIESNFDKSWKYWGQCKFVTNDTKDTPEIPQSTLSIEEFARQVIAGQWGNGQTRYARLTAAGYNAKDVQDMVNYMCDPTKFPNPKQNEVIKDKVIDTAMAEQYINDIEVLLNKLKAILKEEK